MIAENEYLKDEKIWIKFLRKHWKIFVSFVVIAVLALVGAILVFLWVVSDAQTTGLIPSILNLWTMGHLITFLLHVIFWEIIFIIIPVGIVALLAWRLWWKNLPDDERMEYKQKHLFGKRSRRSDGGGAITFFINILFIIKVYLDGNWNVPIATWKFDYLIYSYVWIIVLVLIIVGIPMAIGGTLWILHQMKKEP